MCSHILSVTVGKPLHLAVKHRGHKWFDKVMCWCILQVGCSIQMYLGSWTFMDSILLDLVEVLQLALILNNLFGERIGLHLISTIMVRTGKQGIPLWVIFCLWKPVSFFIFLPGSWGESWRATVSFVSSSYSYCSCFLMTSLVEVRKTSSTSDGPHWLCPVPTHPHTIHLIANHALGNRGRSRVL